MLFVILGNKTRLGSRTLTIHKRKKTKMKLEKRKISYYYSYNFYWKLCETLEAIGCNDGASSKYNSFTE